MSGCPTDRSVRKDSETTWAWACDTSPRGSGAPAINDLMEDAATAEIAHAQVWQWVHRGVTLSNGRTVTPELVRETLGRELELIRSAVGGDAYADGMFDEAGQVFEEVALAEPFVEFLTGPASQRID